ncbi:MAG: hypothetical protein CVU12_10430 [Bacteroidetes bacterium HGW-Bacteroidetes-7]|jgi:hypothetical protein|nr:MAG: hypothetical protein CVU12_10430 [Bacteroidetes bacterium HGW-Bacteroidetes-7]
MKLSKIHFFQKHLIGALNNKIVNCTLLCALLIYSGVVFFPGLMFDNSFSYKNVNIYSADSLRDELRLIIDEVDVLLYKSEIYNSEKTQNIYLCNNYLLYSFFAPFSRKAFACYNPLTNNIFVAKYDIKRNESYKNNDKDVYTRSLSEVLAHEITHNAIRSKLGYLRFITLDTWINEGYSEFIAKGSTNNYELIKAVTSQNKTNDKPGEIYIKYYLAVNYLITSKGMNFSEIVSSRRSLNEVLHEIELKLKLNKQY